MKMQIMPAITAGLTILLCACTTTKDLERHPEMVAVESPRNQMKEGAAGQKGDGEQGQNRTGIADSGVNKESPTGDTSVLSAEGEAKPNAPVTPAPPVIIEKKIYIEKPIYYPENAPQIIKPGETVLNAAAQGVMKPKDYNGAMILYDYDEKFVYQVFTMPLRVTDIYLQPGEKVIEQPFCGDTTRWSIGGGVSKTLGVDTQHLYLKPSEEGLETTLIINTERRIYHLIIKSFKDTFMLAVMWRYPGLGMPYDFLSQENQRKNTPEQGKQSPDQAESAATLFAIDPALMSTDYMVSYPKGNPPQWLPTLVLDDGKKTYIVLPDTVMHHELPALFGENGEIVNFRVKDNIFVIDRLMRKVQLKLRDVTVEIKKKGA
jgi:type IV secretion system protein VirB9